MIRLLVEEYCHDCPYFEAEVHSGDNYYDHGQLIFRSNTVIKCEQDEKCKALVAYLKKKMKSDARELVDEMNQEYPVEVKGAEDGR